MRFLAAATGALVLAMASAAPARAGIYEVHACGSIAGAAQNAFQAVADSMMSAYSICPPSSGVGTGIVTKATSNGGRAPYLAGAYQIFTAPPGTELAEVTFNPGAIRLSHDWSAGIVAFDSDWDAGDYPYGCYPWNSYCGFSSNVFSIPATVNLYSHSRFRFQTRCVNTNGCDASASSFSPANRGLFSAANVVVRVRDVIPPAITNPTGSLWSRGWHRGREDGWANYTDGSGIMLSRLYVDGSVRQMTDLRAPSVSESVRCNFTRPRPCVDVPAGHELDTTALTDGEHHIRVVSTDAAGNDAQIEQMIQVDNSIPAKPEDVAVSGGEGWRAANRFDVRWSNPAGQVAPIVRAHYRLCAAHGGDCVTGAAEGQGISALGLRVPEPGEWLGRVWLEDAAGNHDSGRASDTVRLRFDDEAPSARFEAQDPGDPRRVRVHVVDRGAGVHDGTVELRRIGAAAWTDVGGRLGGDHLDALVDDRELADGTYEVRARVRDLAGNERTGTDRVDGSPMRLILPLRAGGAIALDRRRCRAGRRPRCRSVQSIRNGTELRGRLTANGGPVGNATVAVLSRPRTGGAFAQTGFLRTGADGRFRFEVGSGTSRTLRFLWEGTSTARSASADMPVRVRARSSIAVDRRAVRNGESVTFSGRLTGRPLPEGGKLVDLQVKLRGRWRTFAAPRAGSGGRWSYGYRFEATRGLVVYRFRARIRREAAYPYELGHSRTVRVAVRG